MGRVINPDYFKVGAGTAGSGASSGGRFGQDRARLGTERARIKSHPPHRVHPPTQGPPSARPVGPSPAMPPTTRPPASTPRASSVPSIQAEAIHMNKPRHGKKRRSAQKRHDDAVFKRTRGIPAAPVTALRDRAIPSRERMPSSMPGSLAARMKTSRIAIGFALLKAIASLPFTLVRVARRRGAARA